MASPRRRLREPIPTPYTLPSPRYETHRSTHVLRSGCVGAVVISALVANRNGVRSQASGWPGLMGVGMGTRETRPSPTQDQSALTPGTESRFASLADSPWLLSPQEGGRGGELPPPPLPEAFVFSVELAGMDGGDKNRQFQAHLSSVPSRQAGGRGVLALLISPAPLHASPIAVCPGLARTPILGAHLKSSVSKPSSPSSPVVSASPRLLSSFTGPLQASLLQRAPPSL